MTREDGYYWVGNVDEWIIAEWTDDMWFITGSQFAYSDSDFDEIDERRIER